MYFISGILCVNFSALIYCLSLSELKGMLVMPVGEGISRGPVISLLLLCLAMYCFYLHAKEKKQMTGK